MTTASVFATASAAEPARRASAPALASRPTEPTLPAGQSDGERARALLAQLTGRSPEGWQLPALPRVVVDRDYVLAAVGLLAESRADAAGALARSLTAWESSVG